MNKNSLDDFIRGRTVLIIERKPDDLTSDWFCWVYHNPDTNKNYTVGFVKSLTEAFSRINTMPGVKPSYYVFLDDSIPMKINDNTFKKESANVR